MAVLVSRDGTKIVFESLGAGPAVILVGGALSTRRHAVPVAELLAPRFRVLCYDRRSRGDSGDNTNYETYEIAREIEDLEALIAEAGGAAMVCGSSAGAILVLRAAIHGLPISKIALWEPPFLVDDSRPPLPTDYVQRVEEMVLAGRSGDAVEYFWTAAVGIPVEAATAMRRADPEWPAMEGVAHSLAYDGRIVGGFALPDGLASIMVPVLALDGGSIPWLTTGLDALAAAMPSAERRTVADQPHEVAAAALAPVLAEFFG